MKDKKSSRPSPLLSPQDRYNQYWMVPLARNPYFTGREEELQEVSTGLRAGSGGLAISAAGGSGKTQLALEYAYRHREQYRSVFWAPAASHALLSGAYSSMAQLLDLAEKGQQEQRLIVRAVVDWLAQQRDWLLILDDISDGSLLKDFLPETPPGHLLLTTRNGITGKVARRVRLKKLSADESRRLLLHRCGRLSATGAEEAIPADSQAAGQIVTTLDALPLALDLAGAYIAATACSLTGYLELLRQQNESTDRRVGEPMRKTVHLACEKIAKASSGALDLLRLCAFLVPHDITETLLMAAIPVMSRPVQKALGSDSRRETALNLLQQYALITRAPAGAALIMQREVQSALHALMPTEMERARAELAVRVIGSLFPSLDINDWEACQRLLTHAQMCTPLLDRWQIQPVESAWLLHHAGWYLYVRGEYASAQICEEQALVIYRARFGDEHPATAMILNNLAVTYEERGKVKEALPLHQQALAIRRNTLGENHLETATSLHNLASLYHGQGKGEQALPLLREALAIRRQLLGNEHPDIAATLMPLARLCHEQEDYEEAHSFYQQALLIRRKALGSAHPETLAIMSNISSVHLSQRRFDEAEALLRQALSLQRKEQGQMDLEMAAIVQSLAEVYQARGELDGATFWLQQTLARQREILGSELAPSARMLEALAIAYEDQEQSDRAEALYRQALAIYRKIPAVCEPDVARCCYNLALLYQEQKRLNEARTLLEQALAGWQKHAGAEGARTKQARATYEQLLHTIQQSRHKRIAGNDADQQKRQAAPGEGAPKTRRSGRGKR
jgi:tetratricopeptide (TPR) repeat protein